MRDSYVNNKSRWLEVANIEGILFMCYCRPYEFCHRRILVDMFEKVCKSNGIEFSYLGEIEGYKKK